MESNLKILAFGHRKNVGKDTCVRFLKTHLRLENPGINIVVKGFADKVKEICYDLYGWAGLQPAHFYEEPGKHGLKEVVLPKIGKSPRQLWIDLGNGLRDRVYEPTWAHYLFHMTKADVLLINDLRFPTEADYIKDFGGWTVRVDRPDQPKVTDGADDRLADYTSWTGQLVNMGSLNDLQTNVISLWNSLCSLKTTSTSGIQS